MEPSTSGKGKADPGRDSEDGAGEQKHRLLRSADGLWGSAFIACSTSFIGSGPSVSPSVQWKCYQLVAHRADVGIQ